MWPFSTSKILQTRKGMGGEKEPLRTPPVKRKPRSLVRKEVGVVGLEVFFVDDQDAFPRPAEGHCLIG